MNEVLSYYPYLSIAAISFFSNIPLGYIRENEPKFSLKWLLWIHASIPLIVYLRITWGTSPLFIPVCILLAIFGQIAGSRYRRNQMTQPELDRLAQISDLKTGESRVDVDDSQVLITLLNMGGPGNVKKVRPFLRRIFLDPIILRFPLSQILQPFFAWLLVTLRGGEAEKRYKLIGGGSPIYLSTRAQSKALQKELDRRGRRFKVTFSFNYSEPLPFHTIEEAKKRETPFIYLLSLYPQYSLATTGSNIFYLHKEAQNQQSPVQFIEAPSYYLHDGYIQAFVERICEQVKPGESLDDFYLLFSAHGLPLYFLVDGDPYPFQISQTVARILGRINRQQDWSISYQSAVGPLQWLKPSTDDMIAALVQRGIKKLLIIPISFVTDHIETLCEIDIEYREMAEKIGILDFRMSKAIESHPGYITALADTVEASFPRLHSSESVPIAIKKAASV